jgi:hypothetical protein
LAALRLSKLARRVTETKLWLPQVHRRLSQTTVRLAVTNLPLSQPGVRLGEPEFHLPKMKLLHRQTKVPLREAEHGAAVVDSKKIDSGFVQNPISSP